MSNINIKRAIANIRSDYNSLYHALVEMIVNAIQAIDEIGIRDGRVMIRVLRVDQLQLDQSLQNIESIEIEDNGIGFKQSTIANLSIHCIQNSKNCRRR